MKETLIEIFVTLIFVTIHLNKLKTKDCKKYILNESLVNIH